MTKAATLALPAPSDVIAAALDGVDFTKPADKAAAIIKEVKDLAGKAPANAVSRALYGIAHYLATARPGTDHAEISSGVLNAAVQEADSDSAHLEEMFTLAVKNASPTLIGELVAIEKKSPLGSALAQKIAEHQAARFQSVKPDRAVEEALYLTHNALPHGALHKKALFLIFNHAQSMKEGDAVKYGALVSKFGLLLILQSKSLGATDAEIKKLHHDVFREGLKRIAGITDEKTALADRLKLATWASPAIPEYPETLRQIAAAPAHLLTERDQILLARLQEKRAAPSARPVGRARTKRLVYLFVASATIFGGIDLGVKTVTGKFAFYGADSWAIHYLQKIAGRPKHGALKIHVPQNTV